MLYASPRATRMTASLIATLLIEPEVNNKLVGSLVYTPAASSTSFRARFPEKPAGLTIPFEIKDNYLYLTVPTYLALTKHGGDLIVSGMEPVDEHVASLVKKLGLEGVTKVYVD